MEDLIPFLFVIGYLVLSVIGRLMQGKKPAEKEAEAEGEPSSLDRVLKEMMRQAGVDQVPGIPAEPEVASEHRQTAGEHRQTAGEHRQTWTETHATASEHVQTAAEMFATPSEHAFRASEHVPSFSEHLKGDVVLPPVVHVPPTSSKHQRRSKLGQAIVSDLQGGRQSLARGMVLREILGPPVGLRDPT